MTIDAERLASEAASIDGVWSVQNLLHLPGERRRGARSRLTAGRRASARPLPGAPRPGRARGRARGARPRPPSSGVPRAGRSRAARAPRPQATTALPGHQRADRHVVHAGHRVRAADVEAPTVDRGPRARPRLERADLAVDLHRRPAPLDPAVGAGERTDKVAARLVLRLGLHLPASPGLEHRRDDLRRELRELGLELRRRLPPGQRHRPVPDDRPGVELRGHDHERHAALGVAGEDGAGHRCGAPVARQERRVDVERRARASSSRSAGTSWP